MVIAFVHMLFGTVLKMINELKRGQTKRFYYDSLPKLVLMFTTIGYLVALIVVKWLTNYHGRESEAPSIINSMLEMFLGYNPDRKISVWGTIEREK
jgi:vacuolar-type H+-ATPase subunit I/STV1